MPKVKYLKDLCSGQANTVRDVQDYEASVLIQLGVAELFDDGTIDESSDKQIASVVAMESLDLGSATTTGNILLNLNDTPVIDDFGNVATISTEITAKPEPKPRKNAKKGA